MKKIFCPLIALLFINTELFSQKFPVSIAPSLQHAIGEFTTTHSFGIGVEAGSARHWFEPKETGNFYFTWKAGFAYYSGKKVNTSGFENKYPGYSVIHAFAGIQFNPVQKTCLRLFAGPGIGIYSGNTRINIETEFDATYLLNETLAIGPAIIMMKETGAYALWSIGIKGVIKL